jgi:hypothetical protein
MRLVEIVTLRDILGADSYVKLLRRLTTDAGNDINVTRIKNRIIQSWKKGMKNRKHYDDLLSKVNIKLNDIIK